MSRIARPTYSTSISRSQDDYELEMKIKEKNSNITIRAIYSKGLEIFAEEFGIRPSKTNTKTE